MLTSYLKDHQKDTLTFFDEMVNPDGVIWEHWRKLLNSYDQMSLDTMVRKHREVQRLLRENGVTYNVYGDPEGINRPWDLDPIPMVFSSSDWQQIEDGLLQRVDLLNHILLDLYGSRTLLRASKIPLEMIYNHGGFLRQADKLRLKSDLQLIHYSADMARGPNGQMWVLNDRTDAPSGAGYALENRAAMTRVFPKLIRENKVRKISSYYQTLRDTLSGLAPIHTDNPRIVILSPGATNETYFEHAYLSSFLGFTMAFGQDLTVRDGYVWLRTVRGLEKVDVILRRVDDVYCDPLEFKGDSQLGVVGLMEAVRQKKVSVVNPIGCRILENPGLMAFLPSLCREILGQDLILPSVATWWCGQEREKKYVLDNLPGLIIKSIYRDHENHSVDGAGLSHTELEFWRNRIRKHPYLFVGQERVHFSTTPSLVDGNLEARNALFRSYVAANLESESYVVMPGGLARSSISRGFFKVSSQMGGISKDAWVVGQSNGRDGKIKVGESTDQSLRPTHNVLPSRSGESLYWLGRYLERVVYTLRLMRIVLKKYNESDGQFSDDEDQALLILLKSLTVLTSTYPGFVGVKTDRQTARENLAHPKQELVSLALDADRPGTLAHSLQAVFSNSFTVRDRLSLDTWRILDSMKEQWSQLGSDSDLATIHNALDHLIIELMAFNGLSIDSMTRESSWQLLNIGRYVESGVFSANLMRYTLGESRNLEVEKILMDVVLQCNDSLITYRYRYRSNLQLAGVLQLLITVDENPRALLHFLHEIEKLVNNLPRGDQGSTFVALQKKILECRMIIQLCDIETLTRSEPKNHVREALDDLLYKVANLLGNTSDLIVENYFSHTLNQYSFVQSQRLPNI